MDFVVKNSKCHFGTLNLANLCMPFNIFQTGFHQDFAHRTQLLTAHSPQKGLYSFYSAHSAGAVLHTDFIRLDVGRYNKQVKPTKLRL